MATAVVERKPIPSKDMLTRGKDIAAMLEYWDLTDALIEGVTTVRLAGEKFFPKFIDETKEEYDFRLQNTKFTNIYNDIVESLASKPFEQDITLIGDSIPENIQEFVKNVDGSGSDISNFASSVFYNGINSAIDWIFVDYPSADQTATVRTVADQKRTGIRPFWSRVLGRNIIKATATIINGDEVLTYIKIFEPGDVNRVRIFERQETGVIHWELWEKDAKKDEYFFLSEDNLTIPVIPLVPFATGRRDGKTFKYQPAMRAAADLQVELYQDESGLKFAKRLACYPILTGNGIKPELMADGKTPKRLAVGPGRVLYAPPNGNGQSGEWRYIEPSAQTLKQLSSDIKDTIQQLRELGRQPLTAQSGNLTVITTAYAAGKAKSAVGAWAMLLGNALEKALNITKLWLNTKDFEPKVSVYTDFDNFIDGKDYDQLRAMREKNDISQLTYWDELKRRGLLSSEFNSEDETKRLLDEVPGDGEDTGDDTDQNDDPDTPQPVG